MAKGGISPSGRVLRFVIWRAPAAATKYSIARNTAAASEEGKRVLALAGFGFWVFLFWKFAQFLHGWLGVVLPLQLAGLFGLLLIWRIIGLLRRWWAHRRQLSAMARNAQVQRQTYEILTALPGQIQQLARNGISEGKGLTMFGSMRHSDPTEGETGQTKAHQRREVLDMLGDEQKNLRLGDEFEPIMRMPKWMRRKKDKGEN